MKRIAFFRAEDGAKIHIPIEPLLEAVIQRKDYITPGTPVMNEYTA